MDIAEGAFEKEQILHADDVISQQMAAAVEDISTEHPIIDVETEQPVEVEHVYVQTDEEIGGEEVKQ